jgi:hypothetical protein
MFAPDGTDDPSFHVFNRHTRGSLWFTPGFFFGGGNRCPNVLQSVRSSAGNNQPAFSVHTPDQAVPGMKVEQLAHDFGNGKLFFAGESAFSKDFHDEPRFLIFLTIVRKYRYRRKESKNR